ncbi:RNA-binding signal recognition particle 68 domain-containing protein [Ditylenchus destructor]|uniref:Signal recognition particle subunit SRP68 n=1 Tax=Ditylenchus destructor TaxID=166010 RepID=A0AAD4N8Q1_9BILA|nr:RNA-binding signal recognition particle 68 domain-containing protein [Ditylenchus destructor]
MATLEEPANLAPPFETISVLRLIKDAQQKHGLRQGNYLRYRGYCSRRIRRLRTSLKVTHQYKCFPKRAAKFVARSVTPDVVTDVRFAEILIFEVERHWAYAMQLKLELGNDILSRKKFHMRQKLRRAGKSARNLETMAKSCESVTVVTRLEVQAYSAFILATLAVEFKLWRKAMELCRTVKKIYEKLSTSIKDQELVDLYATRCREVQNTLRLCEYNCSDEVSPDDAGKVPIAVEDELDLDFNKLNVLAEEKQTEIKSNADEAAKHLLKQLEADWKSVDLTKLKALKPNISSLPLLQPMPCKPMFFDLAINYLKEPLTKEKLEGGKKNKKKTKTAKSPENVKKLNKKK